MANTTNFNWETPDDTDLVKDGAAAIRTLGSSIDTSFVDLKGGTTGQILSKASNTDLDYTWIANDQGDITEVQAGTGISVASGTGPIPVVTNTVATTFDAKGDLVVGTGADTFAKLTVGTNGYTLVADSAETTGLKWQAPAGGGLVFITSNTFSGSSGVNINNCFTSTYDNYIIILGRATSSGGANVEMRLRVSGADATAGNYVRQILNASGTSLAGQRSTNQTEWAQIATAPATTENSFMFFKIFNPARAVATYATTEHNDGETGNGLVLAHRTYTHTLTTAYDGFTIFPSSGTFSGTVRVYGLANS
jgi:hypothetical protein